MEIANAEIIAKSAMNAFEIDEWDELPEHLKFAIVKGVADTIAEMNEDIETEWERNESVEEQLRFAQELVRNLKHHIDKVADDSHLGRNKKLSNFVDTLEGCFDDSMFEY